MRMNVIFLYVIDVAGNSILQYGSIVGWDGVYGYSYKHFRKTISLYPKWEESEEPIKNLKYLR